MAPAGTREVQARDKDTFLPLRMEQVVPERLHCLHPGRFPRPNCIKLGAPCSDLTAGPAFSSSLDKRPPELPELSSLTL